MVNLQKEVYYRLGIYHLDLTSGENCQGWLPINPRMVNYQPNDGHLTHQKERNITTDLEFGT